MSNQSLVILIFFAALAAFIPRIIPMLYFSTRPIPAWFDDWMKYVPVSLFSALVAKDVFLTSAYQFTIVGNLKVLATLFVFFIAYKTRSMGISVVLGLLAIMLLSLVFS